MRITKISVKGLFGMFDHEIPLNQESRITIVHGPNGVGKSVLVGMVHGLLNKGGELFGTIPFELFQVEFEGDAVIGVEKTADGSKLFIHYDDGNESEFEPDEVSLPEPDELEGYPDDWDGLILSSGRSEWFWQIRNETETELVHTFRLQQGLFDGYGKSTISLWELNVDYVEPTIVEFSNMFFENKFDRTWYANYLQFWHVLQASAKAEAEIFQDHEGVITTDEDLESWVKERHEQLWSIHELMKNKSQHHPIDPVVILFFEIINERCLFKSLAIEGRNFVFVAENGTKVPLEGLSSGEQHLFLLYYQLLFEIEPDTLVMIDEPEISMNVVWQRNFLKDLQRIIELRKFDVLIATHSPMIVHDKWDWVVHLGEKVDD